MTTDTKTDEGVDAYAAVVAEKPAYLFCDNCGGYPLELVHGHFVCPECRMPTKCCEGGPLDL